LDDHSSIQNDLKQGDALLPLLLNVASEYGHLEGPVKPDGTEMKWDTSAVGLC
jgi:hypothetical protein